MSTSLGGCLRCLQACRRLELPTKGDEGVLFAETPGDLRAGVLNLRAHLCWALTLNSTSLDDLRRGPAVKAGSC
jgi:hypothetical protein